MKKETSKEIGKGLIGFGNLVGGLSIINGLFGSTHNAPVGVTVFIIAYTVLTVYLSGAILIDKGID